MDNCAEKALCMDTDGSFMCTCNIGYTGDGATCNGEFILALFSDVKCND